MEELDVDGLFWLAGQPDKKVAGRLKFDAANGAELNLIGAFHGLPSSGTHDLQDVFSPQSEHSRIFGVAGKRLLTLDRCMHGGTSMGTLDIVRERYFPEVILSGVHFEEDEPLEFNAVHLELQHLEHWVWKSGIQTNIESDGTGRGISEIQVSFTPLPKSVVTTDIGTLELKHTFGFRPDPVIETTITQGCSIGMRFDKPYPLEDAIKVGSTLQNLLTVGVHSLSHFEKVMLSHPALVRTLSSGREVTDSIYVYAQFRGSNVQKQERTIHPAEMLFTFEDIGGLDGVAKWLKTSAKFRLVIDSLLSHWYLPTIYTDDRLLNMIIAAEALHRIRIKKQNFDFCDALIDLAVLAGDPFKAIVRDVESWAKEVVQARINHLVHRGLHGNLEGKRMYDLSESLYFLVVLCLLRECGIPEETLSKMQNHRRFGWVSEQLRSA